MYIELSTKGVQDRLLLIEGLLNKARSLGISVVVKTPFAFSIQHDLQVNLDRLLSFLYRKLI
ncbi:unnamed protein product [Gongylonema pulchrum]|uniref:Resolvase/invertase-type recombinase catalytic domain-containing protein n=1 Tax=Gongylonema pulchrum TaxID=637853 RepID=A0A183DEN4_9BILA|nr:unnamed protein product [Gongylonema pulchrum]